MSDKKPARFIDGDRIVTVMDVNEDELDEVVARLAAELEEAFRKFEEEEDAKPGFINDHRKR